MAIIGITGLPGTGKSYLSSYLGEIEGNSLINADKIGHMLLTQKEIIEHVDASYADVVENGVIIRKKLGAVVFSSKDIYNSYNSYISTFMKKNILENCFNLSQVSKNVIVDAALIYEWGIEDIFDTVIYCTAANDRRLEKIEERGDVVADYLKRESFLLNEDDKISSSDIVVKNNYDEQFLTDIKKIKEVLANE